MTAKNWGANHHRLASVVGRCSFAHQRPSRQAGGSVVVSKKILSHLLKSFPPAPLSSSPLTIAYSRQTVWVAPCDTKKTGN